MIIFIAWIALCLVTGAIAENKGRSSVGFFFLSFFLSPLVGLIVVAVAARNNDVLERRAIRGGAMKKCPHCAEMVKADAVVCRYCHREFAQSATTIAAADTPSATRLPERVPPIPRDQAMDKASRSGLTTFLMVTVGSLAVVSVGSFIYALVTEPATKRTSSAAITATLSESDDRAAILKRAINGVGESCDEVTRVFFQGGRPSTEMFWNAGCRNGNAYSVSQKPDGSARVLSCEILKAVAKLDCFVALDSQR